MRQMFIKDFNDSLLTKYSYHEAIIKKIEINENNFKLILSDGYGVESDAYNEINFINCEAKYVYGLEGREIYQIHDLDGFPNPNKNKWYMSFLIYMENMDGFVYEKVTFEASNIIFKRYESDKVIEQEDLNEKYGVLNQN